MPSWLGRPVCLAILNQRNSWVVHLVDSSDGQLIIDLCSNLIGSLFLIYHEYRRGSRWILLFLHLQFILLKPLLEGFGKPEPPFFLSGSFSLLLLDIPFGRLEWDLDDTDYSALFYGLD